jgi:hypothetical protein
MITKICFKCNEEKSLLSFHKHSKMKDGRLNKCASCVVSDVKNWRLSNPTARNKDYERNKYKLGIMRSRSEYATDRKASAKGRRAVVSEYTAKRRIKTNKFKMTDFDSFVLSEAGRLCESREKITGTPWHIDHIIPLCHRSASGLHNAFNVQVVPAAWNIKKGNRNMNTYFNIT